MGSCNREKSCETSSSKPNLVKIYFGYQHFFYDCSCESPYSLKKSFWNREKHYFSVAQSDYFWAWRMCVSFTEAISQKHPSLKYSGKTEISRYLKRLVFRTPFIWTHLISFDIITVEFIRLLQQKFLCKFFFFFEILQHWLFLTTIQFLRKICETGELFHFPLFGWALIFLDNYFIFNEMNCSGFMEFMI